jgi:hypothetical protein
MKTKTLRLTFAMFLATAAFCFASNPLIGTWKLDNARSRLTPGTGDNTTVVYHSVFFKMKVTVDGIDAKGRPMHSVWTGRFDGKDYPVTGDPDSDMRSYKKVDDHTLDLTVKKAGKVVATGRIVVSADGQSRTIITNGTDLKGRKFKNRAVYSWQIGG